MTGNSRFAGALSVPIVFVLSDVLVLWGALYLHFSSVNKYVELTLMLMPIVSFIVPNLLSGSSLDSTALVQA